MPDFQLDDTAFRNEYLKRLGSTPYDLLFPVSIQSNWHNNMPGDSRDSG